MNSLFKIMMIMTIMLIIIIH